MSCCAKLLHPYLEIPHALTSSLVTIPSTHSAPVQEQGIDFPVRSPDEQAPILTPPTAYQPPTVLLSGAAPPAGTAAATAAAAGLAHAGARGGGGDAAAGEGADPFAGMSAEDRAAVQAAMAEMEEEERAVRESGEQQGCALR